MKVRRLAAAAAVLAAFFAPSRVAYAQREAAAPPRSGAETRFAKLVESLPRAHPEPYGSESTAIDALALVMQAEGWMALHVGRFAARDELVGRYPWLTYSLERAERYYVFAFEAGESSYRVDAVPRRYDRRQCGFSFVATDEQRVRGADRQGAKADAGDPVVATLTDGGSRVTTDAEWRRALKAEEVRVREWVDFAEDAHRDAGKGYGTVEQLVAAGLLTPAFAHEGDYGFTIDVSSPGSMSYTDGLRSEREKRRLPEPPAPDDPARRPETAVDAGPPVPEAPPRTADDETGFAVRRLFHFTQFERIGPRIGGYLSLRELASILPMALAGPPEPGDTRRDTFGKGAVPEADRTVTGTADEYDMRFEVAADRSTYRIWMTPARHGATHRLSLYVEGDGVIRGADLGGAEAGPSTPPLADVPAWIARADEAESGEGTASFEKKLRAQTEVSRSIVLGVPTYAVRSPVALRGVKDPAYARLDLTITTRVRTAATYVFHVESDYEARFFKPIEIALRPGDDHVTLSFDAEDPEVRTHWLTGDGDATFKVTVARKGTERELVGEDDDHEIERNVTSKSFTLDGVRGRSR